MAEPEDLAAPLTGARFTVMERRVIVLGVTDPVYVGKRKGVLERLFGPLSSTRPQVLANKRLEALRHLASALTHHSSDLVPEAVRRALDAGFSRAQLDALARDVEVRSRKTSSARSHGA